MGIEKLPVDLLQHIIETAVPPVTTSDTVGERYRTLLACSLVSQTWRSVAQPELFRIVGGKSGWAVSVLAQRIRSRLELSRLVEAVKVHQRPAGLNSIELSAFAALKELFIGFGGTLDLAVLTKIPQLHTLSVWVTHVVSSSHSETMVLPALRVLSTCYGRWDHSARAILSPRHLPALQGLAFLDGPESANWMAELSNWRPDLRDFPPSLRIVANGTAQLSQRRVEHTVLYMLSMDDLLSDVPAGVSRSGLPLEDIRHLLLTDADRILANVDDGMAEVLQMVRRLPQLKTVFVAINPLSSTSSSREAFSAYIEDHKIKRFNLDWSTQFAEGSLVPVQWLHM